MIIKNFLSDSTVPSRYLLRDGTVPSRYFLCDGTVPSRYSLQDGTVPSPNHYLTGIYNYSNEIKGAKCKVKVTLLPINQR